jgi:hypothetical protein
MCGSRDVVVVVDSSEPVAPTTERSEPAAVAVDAERSKPAAAAVAAKGCEPVMAGDNGVHREFKLRVTLTDFSAHVYR